jgi:membrane protein YdbS with pleckstrin-like domain
MENYDIVKNEYTEEELIEIAKKRIKIKRELYSHIAAYCFVNSFLVFIYFIIVGDFSFSVHFWPIWVISAWGLGLLFHVFESLQELNFKYNVRAVNKELERIKKKLDVE